MKYFHYTSKQFSHDTSYQRYKRTWHTWYLYTFCKQVVLLQIFKHPLNQNEKFMHVFRHKHVNIHTK